MPQRASKLQYLVPPKVLPSVLPPDSLALHVQLKNRDCHPWNTRAGRSPTSCRGCLPRAICWTWMPRVGGWWVAVRHRACPTQLALHANLSPHAHVCTAMLCRRRHDHAGQPRSGARAVAPAPPAAAVRVVPKGYHGLSGRGCSCIVQRLRAACFSAVHAAVLPADN